MSATRKPVSGDVDGLRSVLRRRHADPPAAEGTGGPAEAPEGAPTGAGTAAPPDAPSEASGGAVAGARVDARVREGAEPATDASESAPAARTPPGAASEPQEAIPEPQRPSQGPRRMLEVKARAYRGGWDKLRPRAVALAEAAAGVLTAGGTPNEVRGLLAEIGIDAEAIPPEVQKVLRRR